MHKFLKHVPFKVRAICRREPKKSSAKLVYFVDRCYLCSLKSAHRFVQSPAVASFL